MGTEISDLDLVNIKALCEQVVSLSEYRIQLFDYLKNRMAAIAPNLTMMVGELVGARLIAHSGSLLNLAKHPASTVQILGAEKALFRALKSKTDTPKYGLIYHASLIGQATPKNKGKISRVLAAKTALAIRVDALGDNDGPTIGIDSRLKVEARIRQLEGGQKVSLASAVKTPGKTQAKYDATFNDASDIIMSGSSSAKKDDKKKKEEKKKRSRSELEEEDEEEESSAPPAPVVVEEPKKKKSKIAVVSSTPAEPELISFLQPEVEEVAVDDGEKKKKKKKKDKQ
eukprot:gene23078-29903_t